LAIHHTITAPDPFWPEQLWLYDAAAQQWLEFATPVALLVLPPGAGDGLRGLLEEVEQRCRDEQLHGAGFLSYEAAPLLGTGLRTHPPGPLPLAWFALFRDVRAIRLPAAALDTPILDWQPTVDPASYRAALEAIHRYIAAGDSYQVNFSLRLRATPAEAALELFLHMIRRQGPGLGGWLQTPRFSVASASHELFFSLSPWQHGRRQILSRPMKGTTARGAHARADARQGRALQASSKDRAENLMIVDMVRNDIGRIADCGSVRTEGLFELERYPTLWQMTSRVEARTGHSLAGIMAALFPAASITGAPKHRTMELITELETTPRGLYTGTLGFLRPDGSAQFNVAIRTAVVDHAHDSAEYGVGGGIVWDSRIEAEWRETQLKAQILERSEPSFELLETLAWDLAGGYRRLQAHLQRLQCSAEHFCRPFAGEQVEAALRTACRDWSSPQRVRLRIDAEGVAHIEAAPLGALPEPYRLRIAAPQPLGDQPFVFHKTTYRPMYDEARRLIDGDPDACDVLLQNQRGEITESCIANLMVELDGRRLTPALHCGLLPGLERAALLASGELTEAVIGRDDLLRADGLWLMNSVRGVWPVELAAER